MLTYNNIITALNRIADANLQVHSFGSGELWNIATSGTTNYPLMWVADRPSVVKRNKLTLNFSILVMDLVHKDTSNEQEVLSDTLSICLDVLSELTHPDWGFNLDTENLNVPIEAFTERFDDEVSGWKFDLSIDVDYVRDRCAIPQTSINHDLETETTGYVTIYDRNGALVTTVAAGGSYTIPCGLLGEDSNQLYAD